NPGSCEVPAGTASGSCSKTGPTPSKNGSPTTGDSSRCGSIGTGSFGGSLDFESFNRLIASPAWGDGNVVGREGGLHGVGFNETCRGPAARPLPRMPVVRAGTAFGLSTAVSPRGSRSVEPGTVNLYRRSAGRIATANNTIAATSNPPTIHSLRLEAAATAGDAA